MNVVYAGEPLPDTFAASLFLAGPSPRTPEQANWRPAALQVLSEAGFTGTVFVPLPRGGVWPSYLDQVGWELAAMNRSDLVTFWMPRSAELPGLTSNVEFGALAASGKVLLGAPAEATSVRYLQQLAERHTIPTFDRLDKLLDAALAMLGGGSERSGGQCDVPLHVWSTPAFQAWMAAQTAAGNRLDGATVLWVFSPPGGPRVLFYAVQVNVWVAAEARHKDGEFVIGRPDVAQTVVFAPGADLMSSRVLLVREFRSPAATSDGFCWETPGGSSSRVEHPCATAAEELFEETGMRVVPGRFVLVASRQVAATLTSHRAVVYAVELSAVEMDAAALRGGCFGNAHEGERTHPAVVTVGALMNSELLDWANVGMVLQAVGQVFHSRL